MERGEGRAEPDCPTGEENVLCAGVDGLELSFVATSKASDKEMDGRFVEMLGQIKGGAHIAQEAGGEVLALSALDGGANILLENGAIAICDPAPLLRIVDGHEHPRLPISA